MTRLPCAIAAAVTTLALATPSTAPADPPAAHTDPSPQIKTPVVPGPWAAEMRGDVTTGGLDTTYYFQYAPDSEQFCTSEGASGTPSSSAMQILPAGFGRANVGVEVYGLASGSSYCYRLFTTNSDGTAYGGVDTFTYVLPPPGVPSTGLTTTGASTATMVGRVSPNGQATAVEVVYDVAGSEFCTNQSSTDPAFHTPPVGIAADVVASQVVSLILSGLTPGTQYCAGLLATNPSGATLVRVNPFTAGVPVVEPLGVVAVGRTAATVSGTVDPVAQPTTYAVAYDLASSPWCRSNGSLGKPSFLAGGGALRFTDVRSHNVTAEVTGLAPRISYCLVLMARNGSGAAFAGTPTPLLAKVAVSVFVGSDGEFGAGSSFVASPLNRLSCRRNCLAVPFPRGTVLSLQAFPAPGWTFIQWNPLIDGGYGPPPPSRPCANSQALVCATTLTTNIIVEAVFYRPAVTTCVLLPLGPAVRNSSLGVRVRCTTPVSITLAGVLSERQPSGRRATFALRTIHRLHVGRGWTLHPRLPLDAVAALKTGATGSVRFTLTYQNASVGTGLATARVGPLTVSSTGS